MRSSWVSRHGRLKNLGRRPSHGQPSPQSLLAPSRNWPFPRPLLWVLLISVAVFATLAVEVWLGRSIALDRISLRILRVPTGPAHLQSLRVFGEAGSAEGTIAISALVLAILVGRRRRGAALFFAGAVAVAALSPPLKLLFDRPSRRYEHEAIGFFPSGHATGSMAVGAAIVALAWDTRFRTPVVITAAIAVVGVGLTAVYFGGHWPTDVVGGWALALAWVSLACIVSAACRTRPMT